VSDSPPPAGDPEDAEQLLWSLLNSYTMALGGFIDTYADLERTAFLSLEEGAGIAPELVWLLTGARPNLQMVRERLEGLSKLRLDAEAQAEMEAAFRQWDIISKLRDRLIHVGATWERGGEALVIRRRPGRHRGLKDEAEVRLHIRTLHQLTHDVDTIRFRLLCHFAPQIPPVNREVICEGGRRAWRYRPLPPKTRAEGRPPTQQ
jgi:hypothetical protein